MIKPTFLEHLLSLLPKNQASLNVLGEFGIRLVFSLLEKLEKENPLIEPPVTVNSEHTKHALVRAIYVFHKS